MKTYPYEHALLCGVGPKLLTSNGLTSDLTLQGCCMASVCTGRVFDLPLEIYAAVDLTSSTFLKREVPASLTVN